MKKNTLLIFFLITLTFSAYSFMLSGSFKTMDDEVSIVRNEEIKSFANVGKIMTSSFFGGKAYYRPLVSLSYMLEYHLFNLRPFYFYFTNILLHIFTSLIIFAIIHFIFRQQALSFAVSLLFAIHPVHWEAVSNIPGRAILLSGFFSIFSFYFFCRFTERGGRKGWYAAAIIAFILGLLSKESSGILPVLLLSYQFFLVRRKQDTMHRWILPVVPFFFLDIIYVAFRHTLGITQLFYWRSVEESLLGGMTFLRSVITYLRLLVMPVDLQFDRSRQLFENFLNGEVLLTVLFFALLAVAAIRFRKNLSARILFFASWFCIELFPVSQVFVSIGVQPGYISTAEHFLYTPSVGIFVLLVLTFQSFYRGSLRSDIITPKIFKIMIAGAYFFLFLMTIAANLYSSQEIAMFERTLALNPNNTRIRNSLGLAYAKINHFPEAEAQFRKVLEIAPWNVRARIALGKALCDQGKLWEGIEEYEKIRDAGNLTSLLEENLSLTYRALARQLSEISEKSED